MSKKIIQEKQRLIYCFKGSMVAAATPYNVDGSVNIAAIKPYLEHLIKIKVNGVYILGTTGESFALTNEEKIKIIKAWYEALKQVNNDNRLLAIVNISAMSILDSQELAKLVQQLNDRLDGVALLQPLFYPVDNAGQMVDYVESILKHCPDMPLLYYHFPGFTGQPKFDVLEFLEEALNRLPNQQLSAMKFTDTNIILMGTIQTKYSNRIKLFAGYDETLLAAKSAWNIDSGICATFSLKDSVESFQTMLNAVDNGMMTEARQCQKIIMDICQQCRSNGNFFKGLKQNLETETKGSIRFGPPRLPIAF